MSITSPYSNAHYQAIETAIKEASAILQKPNNPVATNVVAIETFRDLTKMLAAVTVEGDSK